MVIEATSRKRCRKCGSDSVLCYTRAVVSDFMVTHVATCRCRGCDRVAHQVTARDEEEAMRQLELVASVKGARAAA